MSQASARGGWDGLTGPYIWDFGSSLHGICWDCNIQDGSFTHMSVAWVGAAGIARALWHLPLSTHDILKTIGLLCTTEDFSPEKELQQPVLRDPGVS